MGVAAGVPVDAFVARGALAVSPTLAPPARMSTGSPHLDDLLGGGYPCGATTLLYGPPFSGKQVLQQMAFVGAACRGIHATFILHSVRADTMSRRLQALDPRFAAAERGGLVTYVDVHAHFLGEATTHPNALTIDDPHDPARLVAALEARGAFTGPCLLAIQSASTALLDLGPAKVLQYLRTLLGGVVRAGGVALLCMQAGMHPDADVQMARDLCAGTIELRRPGDAHGLHVEGVEATASRLRWKDYEFTPDAFHLVRKPSMPPAIS